MRVALLILIILSACTSYKPSRKISSRDNSLSNSEEDNIARRAYRCLNKVEFLNTEDLTFKKDDSFIRDAFSVCLSEYIQIKTISPEGNEEKAVIFWSTIFENLMIPYKVYQTPSLKPSGKKRWNLVATLPANNDINYDWSKKQNNKSIIVTHHMDVVSVLEDQWLRPELTFSGAIESYKGREYVWGRGAFDMKGMGINHFLSMYLYKKKNPKRNVDIHFLALADEEENGSGAIGTLKLMGPGKELHALSAATVLLNEGGGSIEDVPDEGTNLVAISAEQKGGAWLKLSRKTPLKLFKSLNKLGLLNVDKRQERKNRIDKKIKCSVTEVEGPTPKVNVVTSKLKMTLNCLKEMKSKRNSKSKEAFLSKVASVIKKGFDDVKFDIQMNGQNLTVDIDTQSSSHGSVGLSLSAIDILATSLYRLRIFKMKRPKNPKMFKHKRTDATKVFISKLQNYDKKLKFFNKFSFIPFVKRLILKEIESEFDIDGLFKTKCLLTNFLYDKKNTTAYVDCRLLHTVFKYKNNQNHAQKFVKHLLRKKLLEMDLKIDMISGWNFTSSPIDTKEYKAIEKTLKSLDDKAIVTAYLNPAGSDSAWFRNPYVLGITDVKPIPSYGVFAASYTPELLSGLHGSNERFPTDQATPSVKKFFMIIKSLDELYK